MNRSTNRIRDEWKKLRHMSLRAGFWSVAPPVEVGNGRQEVGVRIDGRSIASAGPGDDAVSYCETQQIRLILDQDFPASPPGLQIDSPVFHPNIPADGMVAAEDIGLSWSPEMTLDLVLERLWDCLRASRIDAKNAIHVGAGQWYLRQLEKPRSLFPVDRRHLVGALMRSANIVRYRKIGEPYREPETLDPMVIDESIAAPASSRESTTRNSPIHFIE